MIIDSMEILAREGNPINAIFIGQDIENVDLKSYAASKGLANNVWTYGPCYDDQIIGEFFYNASVCVSPGNVGLTAIHALSFGCPVITHNQFPYQNPEFEAIKPGITGDFFEKDNLLSMTEYIKKWTSQTQEEREADQNGCLQQDDSKWNIHYQIKINKRSDNQTSQRLDSLRDNLLYPKRIYFQQQTTSTLCRQIQTLHISK